MPQDKRIMLYKHYEVKDGARHDLVFNLRTLNRQSLATAVYNLSTDFAQLILVWGTATNASAVHQTASVGSKAQAGAWQITDATAGEVTLTVAATSELQKVNSPYRFHITVASSAGYDGALLDWPEGEFGEIKVE